MEAQLWTGIGSAHCNSREGSARLYSILPKRVRAAGALQGEIGKICVCVNAFSGMADQHRGKVLEVEGTGG